MGQIESSSGCDGATTLHAIRQERRSRALRREMAGTTTVTKTFKVDKTVPAVNTVLERGADANGWYNHPLAVAFTGTDATSQVATCTSGRYAGPDSAAALIAGSCTDNAGNKAPASFSFKYDSTPPSIFGTTATHGNRSAQISWRKSSDTKVVEVFQDTGPERAGRIGDLSRHGQRRQGHRTRRRSQVRVPGDRRRRGREPRRAEAQPRRHRRTAEPDSGTADHDEIPSRRSPGHVSRVRPTTTSN